MSVKRKSLFFFIILIIGFASFFFLHDKMPRQPDETKREILIKKNQQQKIQSLDTETLLTDLPENIGRFFMCTSIASNLIQAEQDLLSFYRNSDEVIQTQDSFNQLIKIHDHLFKFQSKISSLIDIDITAYHHDEPKICITPNDSLVCFMYPDFIIQKIQRDWQNISRTIKGFSYVSKEESDWHNFLVFYMKMRLHLLNSAFKYNPPSIYSHPEAKLLLKIFKHTEPFQGMDNYLQENGFRKRPEYRGWIFTAIYFEYVRIAYNKGYINMALRQFLGDYAREKGNEIPEIITQNNCLILLQRYKLIK